MKFIINRAGATLGEVPHVDAVQEGYLFVIEVQDLYAFALANGPIVIYPPGSDNKNSLKLPEITIYDGYIE